MLSGGVVVELLLPLLLLSLSLFLLAGTSLEVSPASFSERLYNSAKVSVWHSSIFYSSAYS